MTVIYVVGVEGPGHGEWEWYKDWKDAETAYKRLCADFNPIPEEYVYCFPVPIPKEFEGIDVQEVSTHDKITDFVSGLLNESGFNDRVKTSGGEVRLTITPIDLAKKLFAIHRHEHIDGDIIYREDELLPILKEAGLPEPDWEGAAEENHSWEVIPTLPIYLEMCHDGSIWGTCRVEDSLIVERGKNFKKLKKKMKAAILFATTKVVEEFTMYDIKDLPDRENV